MYRLICAFSLLLLATLLFSACQPVMAEPAAQQAEETAMDVIDQFLEAYRAYDVDKLLSLHTDDAVWTWIDPGKNFPDFGPEGKWTGAGKDEIRAMFDYDRGQAGFSGYVLWSEVRGDTVTATELWESDWTHEIDAPLITQSTYKLRNGKIADWVWTVSPESSWRVMNTASVAEANKEVVRRLNTEVWNGGNLDLIDELYAEDYVRHQAGYPAELQGRDGLRQFLTALRLAFPDFECSIANLVATDDMVVHYGQVCRGVHQGEWMGMPPSGKEVEFTVMAAQRLIDGKVAEDWIEYDSAAFMQGLGMELVPAQPQAASGYQSPEVMVQGSPIHSANGINFGPDGKLYIASVFGNEIVVMDPETGEILDRVGLDQGVVSPDDLTFGPDGSLYWTAIMSGEVGKLSPDGTKSTVAQLPPGVNPITFSDAGRLFVALDFFGDGLYEIDPDGVEPPRLIIDKPGFLNGMDWGPDGFLYGPIWTQGKVVRVDVETGETTTVADGFAIPAAAKFDSQGQLHVLDQMTGEVVRVDTTNGMKETIATLPPGLDNLAFNAQDRLFVSSADDGFIIEVLPAGETRRVSPGGMIAPSGVAVLPRSDGESVWVAPDIWTLREFDGETGRELDTERTFIGFTDLAGIGTLARDGDNLLMASWSNNAVQAWSPQTREVLESYMDFAVPVNAIRFQGDLVVAELGGTAGAARVIQVNAQDRSIRTTLADAADGLLVPTGLAATEEDLWVSDWATGNVLQIAADGKPLEQPKVIATGLAAPEGMAVTGDGNLLVLETGAGRLSHIDVASGEISTVADGLHVGLPAPDGVPPFWFVTGVAVGPSGTIYVTDDAGSALYRIEPAR